MLFLILDSHLNRQDRTRIDSWLYFLNPAKGNAFSSLANTIVSPTGAESRVLIDAIIKPTIPELRVERLVISGLKVPSLSTINSLLLDKLLSYLLIQ